MPRLARPSLAFRCMDHALSAGSQRCYCFPAGARVRAELLGKGMDFQPSTQAERRLSLRELPLFTVLSPWLHFESPAGPLALE